MELYCVERVIRALYKVYYIFVKCIAGDRYASIIITENHFEWNLSGSIYNIIYVCHKEENSHQNFLFNSFDR